MSWRQKNAPQPPPLDELWLRRERLYRGDPESLYGARVLRRATWLMEQGYCQGWSHAVEMAKQQLGDYGKGGYQ